MLIVVWNSWLTYGLSNLRLSRLDLTLKESLELVVLFSRNSKELGCTALDILDRDGLLTESIKIYTCWKYFS